MLALSVFALLLGTNLVASRDCCVADRFQIGFGGTRTKRIDNKWMLFKPISYEGQTRRVRFEGEAAIDHIEHRYAVNVSWYDFQQRSWGSVRIIQMINESTTYVITESKCFKKAALKKEPPTCVPDGAYLDQTIYVGMNSLQLNTWKMRVGEKKGPVHGDLRFATTEESCIPVFSSFIGKRMMNVTGEYARFEVDGVFFNYTESFSPSSFVIPDICHSTTSKVEDETVGLLEQWDSFQKGMVFF